MSGIVPRDTPLLLLYPSLYTQASLHYSTKAKHNKIYIDNKWIEMNGVLGLDSALVWLYLAGDNLGPYRQ